MPLVHSSGATLRSVRRPVLFRAILFAASATFALSQNAVRFTEINAKIVLEDGSGLVSPPLILIDPGYDCQAQSFLDGTLRIRVAYLVTGQSVNGHTAPGCSISVRLTGYQLFKGWVEDGALIKLYRIGPHEGASVSKNNLDAPPNARKRYESGESAAAKGKWPQAEEQFRAALGIYPQYASAWSELGRALQQQKRLNEAADALNKAREADPQYIKPVAQLAEIAGLQQRWEDEMRLSQQVLKMHPVGFTTAYFSYAQAAFHMGSPEESEKVIREAIRLDIDAQCPESMVLLGMIFEKQGNGPDAAVEYKDYLKLAPHGPEAEHAKEALARLGKRETK